MAGKIFSISYFHSTLFLISAVALSLFRFFSGRAIRRKPYTENEKKWAYFSTLNALVCIPPFFAFGADWLSNPPELLQFLRGLFG